jgi:FAD/FMN-containing dehydrogenase
MANVELAETVMQDFRAELRGELLYPDHRDYDAARRVYNVMIDKRPALIVRCTGVADVVAAVDFTRTHDVPVAVRGGGHNVAGNSTCDGGLIIDRP